MSDKLLQEELNDDLFERLDDSEESVGKIVYESRAYLTDAWYQSRQNKLALVGLCFLTFMLLYVIITSAISPYTYDGQNLELCNIDPSLQHLAGIDKSGRNILVHTVWGGRISLGVGLVAALISPGAGALYGGITSYLGGKTGMATIRFAGMMYSISGTLYVVMIAMVMGPSMNPILIGICISSWMGMARQVRAQVMMLKEQGFSFTAKVLGAGTGRTIFKHLIISSMEPTIVSVTMLAPSAMFCEAFLGLLGVGPSAPQASWGTSANEAKDTLTSYPLQTLWSILAICLAMLALNFTGGGLGDALDPKKKKK